MAQRPNVARLARRPLPFYTGLLMLLYLFVPLYLLICLLLLVVVLLQQGKGGDIAAAFGGSSSQTAFGARAGATVLTRATAILGALFMLVALSRWQLSTRRARADRS